MTLLELQINDVRAGADSARKRAARHREEATLALQRAAQQTQLAVDYDALADKMETLR